MNGNRVKRMIGHGQPAIGLWVSLPCASSTELIASLAWDWLLLDTEHGPASLETVEDLVRAVKGTDAAPIVRVAANDPALIKQALDRGAMGILVPLVNSAAEAEAAVRAAKYPPLGIRGVAGTRANRFGMDLPDYFARWNDEVLVACQVETALAVDRVDDIAAITGVDILFIGPNDLSANLGVFRRFDDPVFTSAVDRIQRAARAHGVAVGYLAADVDEAVACVERGFLFVGAGSDARLLAGAASTTISAIRSRLRNPERVREASGVRRQP
jgi:2-keto-3-deoxy-L-rhamnonate aldolase RhmA